MQFKSKPSVAIADFWIVCCMAVVWLRTGAHSRYIE